MSDNIDVFKSSETIPQSSSASNSDIDAEIEISKRRHKKTIETLNHWFRICTHPFILTVALLAVGIAFCIFYIVSKSSGTKWTSYAAELSGKILSYVATAVFSSMFTWFIENHDKLKDEDSVNS